ncbi:ABC transporter permease [Parachryseolinea silvisoli]|jgi:putative ABC transport system permease protein|uniref:ABC transporter permease n=1 Tax=Parachryseolinea silvisoli TaxID=2873601 RepID=UPI002265D6AB|nr:ABC transporter permease [Parachryseolinea silvisoli]MCD9015141.1 ABC transporter permease [Parachryseolinea silvisoli]
MNTLKGTKTSLAFVAKIVHIALEAIVKNRNRSFLTTLGIIIGVAAVIMTISAGEGARLEIEKQIEGLGVNMVMIRAKQEPRGGIVVRVGKPITVKDYEMLQQNAVWINRVSPVVGLGVRVISPWGNKNSFVYGVSDQHFDIMALQVISGEGFTLADVKAAKKVCLIGETIREELFPNLDPIGQEVRINTVPFTIIGLLEEQGQFMGQDQDDMVVAPYTTVVNRLYGDVNFNSMLASAIAEDHVEDAKQETIALLRESHKLLPDEPDDFEVMTQLELMEITGQITGILTILLAAIASISLLVGGIGIMNIMLVSVTERTREIGIRLALGARESDILTQFLIEAVALSAAGGVVGIGLGVLGNFLIYKFTGFFIPTSYTSIVIGFGFSAMIGVGFGYFPARKAARLNPIDALHYE